MLNIFDGGYIFSINISMDLVFECFHFEMHLCLFYACYVCFFFGLEHTFWINIGCFGQTLMCVMPEAWSPYPSYIWKYPVWISSWAMQLDLRYNLNLNHSQEIREQYCSIVPLPLSVFISLHSKCLSQLISFVLFLPKRNTYLRNG